MPHFLPTRRRHAPVTTTHHHTTTAAPRRRGGLFSTSRYRSRRTTAATPVVTTHHHHHTQKRHATIGDKISGALLKLKGTLTGRPGQKVLDIYLPTHPLFEPAMITNKHL